MSSTLRITANFGCSCRNWVKGGGPAKGRRGSAAFPIPDHLLRRSEPPVRAVCHERRASTTARNCTRDEGRSFGAGSQVLASNRCKLQSTKSDGGERCSQ